MNTDENELNGQKTVAAAPATLIKAVNRGLYEANDGVWTDFRCLWPAYVAQVVLPVVGMIPYEGACIEQVMCSRNAEGTSTAGFLRRALLHSMRWLGAVIPLAVLTVCCVLSCRWVAGMAWGGWMAAALALLFLLLMTPLHLVSMELSFGNRSIGGSMRRIVDGLRHFLSLLSFSLLSLLVIFPVVVIGSAPFGILCHVWISHAQAETMGDASTLPSYFYLLTVLAWLLAAGAMSCAQIVYTRMAHNAWQYFSKQDNQTVTIQL